MVRQLRKIIIFCLAVMLLASPVFITACAKKETTTSAQTTATTSKDQTTKGSEEETTQTSEEEEYTEISIAFWDFTEFGNDPVGKYIEDKLKIKIIPVNLSWDTFNEQIQLFGSTGDMPDCIASYTVRNPSRIYSWINEGLLRSIPEEMVNQFPLVKKVFDDSKALQAVKTLTGAYYFIPRPESASGMYKADQSVIFYRKDWNEKLGITKVPETIDEYYEMLRAYTEEDPDGDGVKDTIGLTLDKYPHMGLFAPYGVDPRFWLEEDGKLIPGYMSKKNIEPLKFFQKIYREGILDPEFTANDYKKCLAKLSQSIAGSAIRDCGPDWIKGVFEDYFHEANPDIEDPTEVLGVMPPLKKDKDSDPAWIMFDTTCGTEISGKVDDHKMLKILEFDNFWLSEEGRYLRYGFEGVDYKIEGGKIVFLDSGNSYPSLAISNFADWNWDFLTLPECPEEIVPDKYKKLGEELRAMYNPWAREERLDATYISTPAKDQLTISWGDNFSQIVTGTEDAETAFNKFVQDCLNKGADKAIEEVNEKLKP